MMTMIVVLEMFTMKAIVTEGCSSDCKEFGEVIVISVHK